MASVVNRETKEYLSSVNTPQYSDPPWLINPDTSLVLNEEEQIPTEFWIIPDEGVLITADRIAWKRNVKTVALETQRDDQLAKYFHYAPNGNDLAEGNLFDPDTFVTPIFAGRILAIVAGVPEDVLIVTPHSGYPVGRQRTNANLDDFTSAELINFYARYQTTREIVKTDYFGKLEELTSFTTEEEIDAFDPYAGWRPI